MLLYPSTVAITCFVARAIWMTEAGSSGAGRSVEFRSSWPAVGDNMVKLHLKKAKLKNKKWIGHKLECCKVSQELNS